MLKKIESMKKATGWWPRWRATRGQKTSDKGQRDRGKWGYIPDGCELVSMATMRAVFICLLANLVMNCINLAGYYHVSSTQRRAATEVRSEIERAKQQLPQTPRQ